MHACCNERHSSCVISFCKAEDVCQLLRAFICKQLLLGSCGGVTASGRGTDQDLLSIFILGHDFLPQFSFRNLQVLPHLAAVLQEGQVAVVDADQLSGSTAAVRGGAASCHTLAPEDHWTHRVIKNID